jgi:hypothetical protein
MKGVSFILFISFLFVACNEQNPFYDTYSPHFIRTQTKYSVDPNTNKEVQKIYEKLFEKTGNLLIYIEYDINSNIASKSDFIYEDGKKIESVTRYNEIGDTINTFSKIYKQNSNGQVYEIIKIDNQGRTEERRRLEYDEKGNLKIEYIEKDNVKIDEMNYDYNYNNSGEVTKIFIRDYQNGEIIKKDSISYSNNKVDFISFDSDGNINNRKSMRFDNNGNIIEELIIDKNNSIIEKYIFRYTFY